MIPRKDPTAAEANAAVTGRESWERELDAFVSIDKEVDFSDDLPMYEGDLVIDGISLNDLARKHNARDARKRAEARNAREKADS